MDQLNVSELPPQDQRQLQQNESSPSTTDLAIKTPVSMLQELLQLYGTEANYTQLQKVDAPLQHMFYFEVSTTLKDAISTALGAGSTKEEAKHAAAKAFLDQLFSGMITANIQDTIHSAMGAGHSKNKPAVTTASLTFEHTADGKESNENGDNTILDDWQSKIQIDLPHKTPIYQLNDYLTRYGITPKFKLLQTDGSQHNPTFRYEVSIGYKDKQITAMGTGKNKKQAMHDSARALLHKLSAVDLADIAIMPSVRSSSSANRGKGSEYQKCIDIHVQSNRVVRKAFSTTVCIDNNDNTKTSNEKGSGVEASLNNTGRYEGSSDKIHLNLPYQTPVYQLNEHLKPYGIRPDFKLLKQVGLQHNTTFHYQVSIGYNDKQITATGAGTSMRHAMQASARALLDKLFAGELPDIASVANNGKKSEAQKNIRGTVPGNGCSEGTADHNITDNNDYANASNDTSKAKIEKLANCGTSNLKMQLSLAHEMPVNQLIEHLKPYRIKPEFILLQTKGSQHNPTFYYQVSIGYKDTQLSAMGSGNTKKQAMHDAARALLDKLSSCELPALVECSSSVNQGKNNNASDVQANMVIGSVNHSGVEGSSKADIEKLVDGNNNDERTDDNIQMSQINTTPVSQLREYLDDIYGISPEYKLLQTMGRQHIPTFHYQVSITTNNKLLTAMGSGSSKKQAKHASARVLLDKLSDDEHKIVDDVTAASMQQQGTDVDKLHLFCTQQALRISFELVEETCETHPSHFTVSCTVLPHNYREIGHGKNKKMAKREAALKMWKRLQESLYLNTKELCLEETAWKPTGLYYQRVEDKVELVEI